MPSNTASTTSRQEVTGHAQLPLSRVKKIIALDSDIAMCSNNAAFLISLATEMFIQTLAEQAHNIVKSERKPRRNIQYRDVANAVARDDALEFLSDIVPRTIPYKDIKAGRAAAQASQGKRGGGAATAVAAAEPGQTTLDGPRAATNEGLNGEAAVSPSDAAAAHNASLYDDEEAEDPSAQIEKELRERSVRTEAAFGNGNGQHVLHNGHVADQDGDVEMS